MDSDRADAGSSAIAATIPLVGTEFAESALAPADGSLSYSTSPPGGVFLSARAAAVHWTEGRGESRVAAARSLVAEAVRAYCSLQPHPGTLSGGSCRRPDDVELEPLDGFATGLACKLGGAAAGLDAVSAAFWLSTAYTSMLPTSFRARFGIFYTPPALTARLLDMAERAGADWRTWHVLDPACGGGAFLGPVALRMAESLRDREPSEILASIAGRLKGLEIDPFAAWLSQFFLESSLTRICAAAGTRLPRLVEVCDSLERVPDSGMVDLVVGNPPYGRIGLSTELRTRYRRSLYGHANLYGIFTDLALRWTKPNGLVAYVTPTSFLAGQYFKALRALMAADAPPVTFDVVESRQGVFEGVLQETMLSVYQRGGPPGKTEVNRISVSANGTAEVLPVGTFQLPSNPSFPWLLPRHPDQAHLIDRLLRLPARLSDWGYRVSTGPLVWNRHKSQLRRVAGPGCAPLVWAESIAGPGEFVFRASKRNHEPYFKLLDGDDWLCIDEPCVLLQRTTSKEQRRRLVAATLPVKLIDEFGSVVVENHINMVRPLNGAPEVSPDVIAALLNSDIVDSAFRCISGSVAVSAFELESLPLPSPTGIAELESLVAKGSGRTRIERCIRELYLGESD